MEIKYEDCAPGCNQYEGEDISVPGDAKYAHARLKMDAGNRFIESQCWPLEGKDLEAEYETGVPECDPENAKMLADLYLQIDSLRCLRFLLPFHRELEEYYHLAVCQSYRARKAVCVEDSRITFTADNELRHSDNITRGNPAEATNGGFALIGPPGSGKSAGIGKLVGHQRQVTYHYDENGYHPQVSYLVVNCEACANMHSFYDGFGAELDAALGNAEPVYEAAIKRLRPSGEKKNLIRRYIEIFSIGIIILDEIEFMSTNSEAKNSIEGILTICNQTKVAVAVVGTEEAFGKIFTNPRVARRFGKPIDSGDYCRNISAFDTLVRKLFLYQWFDEPVEVTDELVDTLYELTCGIVDLLITIYICVQMDYVTNQEKPEVNCDYFRRVVNRRYPGIKKLLANVDLDALSKLNDDVKKENAALIDKQRQAQESARINANAQKSAERRILAGNIVKNVQTFLGNKYKSPEIEKAFTKVMKAEDAADLDEPEVLDRVIAILHGEPERPAKKKGTAKPKAKATAPVDDVQVNNFIRNDVTKEAQL